MNEETSVNKETSILGKRRREEDSSTKGILSNTPSPPLESTHLVPTTKNGIDIITSLTSELWLMIGEFSANKAQFKNILNLFLVNKYFHDEIGNVFWKLTFLKENRFHFPLPYSRMPPTIAFFTYKRDIETTAKEIMALVKFTISYTNAESESFLRFPDNFCINISSEHIFSDVVGEILFAKKITGLFKNKLSPSEVLTHILKLRDTEFTGRENDEGIFNYLHAFIFTQHEKAITQLIEAGVNINEQCESYFFHTPISLFSCQMFERCTPISLNFLNFLIQKQVDFNFTLEYVTFNDKDSVGGMLQSEDISFINIFEASLKNVIFMYHQGEDFSKQKKETIHPDVVAFLNEKFEILAFLKCKEALDNTNLNLLNNLFDKFPVFKEIFDEVEEKIKNEIGLKEDKMVVSSMKMQG